jgi:NAD(P)-dependent dehydrogenase (short-subunit alcohol dehydrogenase family)
LHSFCSKCFKLNESFKTITRDLTSKIAIVTGGRIKIGHSVALKLLRCNCKVIITTRFPTDAMEKYQKEKDYESFKDRLIIYPLDMKNVELILEFVSK